MTFKNILFGLASDPISAATNLLSNNEPFYEVIVHDLEDIKGNRSVSIRVSPKSKLQGNVILQEQLSYDDNEFNDRETAIEVCCKILVAQIFLRGAATLNASHSAPFLNQINNKPLYHEN